MTTIINGSSPSVTFSDGTTQSTAALPLTGGTVTGGVNLATSSGNVGIGTTSPVYGLSVNNAYGINSYDGGAGKGKFVLGDPADNSGYVGMYRSAASTPGTGGLDLTIAAYGQIAFTTGPASFASQTERMRIDSSGNLLIGGTTATGTPTSGFTFQPASGSSVIGIGHTTGNPSGTGYMYFAYNGTAIGSISQNGTTGVLYNLSSDYRLKDNPQPLTGASEFIMALQPKTWDWWDGSGKGVGFIAHEFMEVAKYSGKGEKDAVDAEGKPVYQSIQPSSSEVMANLVAMVQEQQAIITDLTNRLTALEK